MMASLRCPSGCCEAPLGRESDRSESHRVIASAWRRSVLTAMFIAVSLVGGCIVPDQRHDIGGVVLVAPPAPRDELQGEPPASGEVWVSGYWNWVGSRHEWVPGHWVAGRPGRRWVPHAWVRQGDGWVLKVGHWERIRH